MMDKNELFTFYILETHLVLYIFLLFFLIGVYLKWFVFKSLKKWQIIFFPIILCIGLFVFWALQSYNPSYKTYTVDKQYSYYLEEYNINKVLKKIDPEFYSLQYKAFLFDEIEQEVLRSKHLGPWIDSYYLIDCWGFTEEENRFYFTEWDFYNLPRPIDKNAIEQRDKIESSKVYLDWYMISPIERFVYEKRIWGDLILDIEKEKRHYWENGPSPDFNLLEINYDTTSLIFIGSIITFKEYFPIKSVNLSSLKVIDYSYDFNSRVTVLSPLEKKIYIINEFEIIKSYDLYEYSPVKKQIGKREESLWSELEKLPYQEVVDWESLQVVRNSILVDKNNIYMEHNSEIKVIPIKDLGLDVKVVEVLK